MTATTLGRFAATGIGLGALLLLVLGTRAIARRRGAFGRRGHGHDPPGGSPPKREADAAAAERPEGGWSLDLTDDP